ncbi:VIT family protein [Candidatus Saccharibacteria bacterium]|nr:VIT family protein [Candidatus Saccharibacteria bacterium]
MQNKPKYPGPHDSSQGVQSNALRAAVLGANDGIVSVASIVVGVAGASSSKSFILTAGVAGLLAGALSMAVGEYVSVSTQRDTEKSMLARELYLLENYPDEEREELALLYEAKGLSKKTARVVADELSAKDAAAAHFDAELGIDPNDLTNPWQAAIASAVAFSLGAVVPLAAVLIASSTPRIPVIFGAVLVALLITGVLSARASRADAVRATVRVVVGGILAMAITYSVGRLMGRNIG